MVVTHLVILRKTNVDGLENLYGWSVVPLKLFKS